MIRVQIPPDEGIPADTCLCLFNEGRANGQDVDPEKDCPEFAIWHIRYEPDEAFPGDMTSACDAHLGRALEWRKVREFHEFGPACNLTGSWWIDEAGTCVTEETGLEIGFLKRVEADCGA